MNSEGPTLQKPFYTPKDWMRAILWLLWRITLYSLIIVGSVYILGRVRTIIVYTIVAVILAYVMRPIAGWMARKGILVSRSWSMHTRRTIATLWVLIFMCVGGYYSVRFMVSPFVAQVKDVSQNWETEYKPRFDKYSADLVAWYEKSVKKEWRDKIRTSINKGSGNGDFEKNATAVVGDAAKQFGGLAHQIVEIVLLPVLAFYFALDSKHLKHEFVGSLPCRYRKETSRMIHEFNRIMHSFVIGQALLCALAGIVVGLGLWALGVPFALTLGVLAGFTRAIPIIGPIIGGIPIIGLVLVTKGLPVALMVLGFFTFLHFAESKFVMPMLIGERMKLHPVVIIMVLLIGQEFGGLLGMFFAAPLAAILRVMIRRYWIHSRLMRQKAALSSNSTVPSTE
jgi:predicted PurR-regulated permease PerM